MHRAEGRIAPEYLIKLISEVTRGFLSSKSFSCKKKENSGRQRSGVYQVALI